MQKLRDHHGHCECCRCAVGYSGEQSDPLQINMTTIL